MRDGVSAGSRREGMGGRDLHGPHVGEEAWFSAIASV